VLPSKVPCPKISPPTKEASGCCAAHSLLFVPLPKKYTPTCEGISYTKCSAAFAKHPQCNPHPTPFVSPPPLLHQFKPLCKKGLLNCALDRITQNNDSATHCLKKNIIANPCNQLFVSLYHMMLVVSFLYFQ
jgi:hypothetical protein